MSSTPIGDHAYLGRGFQTSSVPWSWRAANAVPPVTPIRSGSTSSRWTAGTSAIC